MNLLDSIQVNCGSTIRHIELYHGDLANIPPTESVDLLVISAFPDDYTPTPRSLIGELGAKGLSVADLAARKAVDLRVAFSCWLSEEIENPAYGFKRILCFEPLVRGKPAEVVGEIFQSLMPFSHGKPPISKVAMPIVATGDQETAVSEIFEPLIDAAYHWMGLGLPIDHLKIVTRSDSNGEDVRLLFTELKRKYNYPVKLSAVLFNYDVFISYSHQNIDAVDYMVKVLQGLRPDIRIFLDRHELNAGSAWQQKIFEAVDDCLIVIAIYSPPYLLSKVCKEEFNIALFRHRESAKGVLFPVYLQSANLPTYMKLVQYVDCREDDQGKIKEACNNLLKELGR